MSWQRFNELAEDALVSLSIREPSMTGLPLNMDSKIEVHESGCWLWTGAKNSNGYGCIGVNGVSKLSHRRSYELLVGEIANGLTIDHLCRVKACVNPVHLTEKQDQDLTGSQYTNVKNVSEADICAVKW